MMKDSDKDMLVVLLVEDNPADVFLVREAIQEEGLTFHMEVAEDGEQALAILDAADGNRGTPRPNFILLDLNLPKQTGEEVLQRVRQSPWSAEIPVVVMTSSESPADRARAMELGATEYFRKPSNLDEFMQLGKLVRRMSMAGRGATA